MRNDPSEFLKSGDRSRALTLSKLVDRGRSAAEVKEQACKTDTEKQVLWVARSHNHQYKCETQKGSGAKSSAALSSSCISSNHNTILSQFGEVPVSKSFPMKGIAYYRIFL